MAVDMKIKAFKKIEPTIYRIRAGEPMVLTMG